MKVAVKKEIQEGHKKVSLDFENKSCEVVAIYENGMKRVIESKLVNINKTIEQLNHSQLLFKSPVNKMYYSIKCSTNQKTSENYCENCGLLKEIHTTLRRKCPNKNTYFRLTKDMIFEFKAILVK